MREALHVVSQFLHFLMSDKVILDVLRACLAPAVFEYGMFHGGRCEKDRGQLLAGSIVGSAFVCLFLWESSGVVIGPLAMWFGWRVGSEERKQREGMTSSLREWMAKDYADNEARAGFYRCELTRIRELLRISWVDLVAISKAVAVVEKIEEESNRA